MRKTLFVIAAALTMAGVGVASAESPPAVGALSVTVSGLKPKGQVLIAVFAGEAAMKAGVVAAAAAVPAVNGAATARFALPPGEYALRLFQDVDGDGKLKLGLFGLPAEPWAFSNNAAPRMGPPRYADARFQIVAGVATTQTLKAR